LLRAGKGDVTDIGRAVPGTGCSGTAYTTLDSNSRFCQIHRMARLARVVIPGMPHHITQRGNRRQPTFFCNAQALRVTDTWERLARACGRSSARRPRCSIPAGANLKAAWWSNEERRTAQKRSSRFRKRLPTPLSSPLSSVIPSSKASSFYTRFSNEKALRNSLLRKAL